MFSTRSSTLRGAFLAATTAAAVVTGSAFASAPKESAPSDKKVGASVKASLKYIDGSKGEMPAWREIRVTIVRDGQPLATDQALPAAAGSSYFTPPRLVAVDLDGDAEPEVLVDVVTAERNRARRTVVFFKKGDGYATDVSDWGTGGYRLADVAGTKAPEFLSADSRVSALYDSKVRGPIRVLRYDGGRVVDVSRKARAELLRDAKQHRRALARARRTGTDPRPEVAAYAVDLVRLGRVDDARSAIRTAGKRNELRASTRSFARKLDAHMVQWGYAKRRTLAGGL